MMIKRIHSSNSIEMYAYVMRKDIISKKEEIYCNNIINRYIYD